MNLHNSQPMQKPKDWIQISTQICLTLEGPSLRMGGLLNRVVMGVMAVQPLLIIHIKILNMMPTFFIMMSPAILKPTQTIPQATLKVHTHMEPAGPCRKYPRSLFH